MLPEIIVSILNVASSSLLLGYAPKTSKLAVIRLLFKGATENLLIIDLSQTYLMFQMF